MTSRKTGIGIAVILLGGAYVAASWWAGGKVREIYQRQLAQAHEASGSASLLSQEYRRGLFSSSADTILTLPPEFLSAKGSGESIVIRVHHDINHAPFANGRLALAVDRTTITRVDGAPPEVKDAFTLDGTAQARTAYYLDGSYRSRISLGAGSMDTLADVGASMRVHWSASTWDVHGPGDLSRMSSALQFGGLDVTTTDDETRLRLDIGAITVAFEAVANDASGLLAGDPLNGIIERLEGTVEHIALETGGAGQPLRRMLRFEQLRFDASTRADDALRSVKQNLSANGTIAGLALDDFQLETTAERIDAKAFAQLQSYLLAASEADEPASFLASAGQDLEHFWQQLTDAGPSYAVRLGATLEGAPARLDFRFGLAPMSNDMRSQRELPWQATLLHRASGNARISLPGSWLPALAQAVEIPAGASEQLAEQLDTFVERGYLRQKDGTYTAEASYDANGFILNGQPLAELW